MMVCKYGKKYCDGDIQRILFGNTVIAKYL